MSWNEPGGDNKDPWSGRGDQKGPPDLDQAIRSLQEKLGKIFGGGGGGGGGGRESSTVSMKHLGFIAGGVVFVWGLSGLYIVDEGNHGVETRFGKYIGTTQAGLNWHIPAPIERVDIVNVKQNRTIDVGFQSFGESVSRSEPKEALMLTKDENYVDVRLVVQYQVKDAKDFLFNVVDPARTLKQVTESAERGVIGASNMDFVLTEGRAEIVTQIKKEIQSIMDNYSSGIQVTTVNLRDAQPPEQVQNAFEDVIKAREDEQRLINEAQAYSNDVVPKARGAAARKMQEAEGYKEQVIAQAEGETNRFTRLLAEYTKAPEVTRKRMYLENMEAVLAGANTVMIDVKGGNNLMYLPLDKITQRLPSLDSTKSGQSPSEQSAPMVETQPAERSSVRGRVARGR
ncbi:MAG: FtsH protease activity modulator HflK [Gammaproteobacteria bacterium]